jgi:hypothetical protein
VLLAGLRRRNHLGLLAALRHQLNWLPCLEALPADCWVVAGKPLPFHLPGPSHVEDWHLDFTVVVAPADEHTAAGQVKSVVRFFSAVGIEFDAPRISAGLSDLHRAPYIEDLAKVRDKVFYTCGDGGLFRDKLHQLVSQVVPLACRTSPVQDRPWFVHEVESYDYRYTTFMQLARKLLSERATDRSLLRLWRQLKVSEAAPFTAENLKNAFLKAQADARDHK